MTETKAPNMQFSSLTTKFLSLSLTASAVAIGAFLIQLIYGKAQLVSDWDAIRVLPQHGPHFLISLLLSWAGAEVNPRPRIVRCLAKLLSSCKDLVKDVSCHGQPWLDFVSWIVRAITKSTPYAQQAGMS
ncbi:hypothetical protein V8E54_002476 [Elaphomyces granulatus]